MKLKIIIGAISILSIASLATVLAGQLADGTLIKGIDSVRIIQGAVKQTILAKIFSYISQFIQKLISAIGLAAIK